MNQYDEQIEHLTKNPQLIELHWISAKGLFKCIGKDIIGVAYAGCLTTIKRYPDNSTPIKAIINGHVHEGITQAIIADERIPARYTDITVEMLPVFKEWQERIDEMQKI